MKAALIRLGRVILGQIVAIIITSTAGITIPYLDITLGAVINAIAKFLRDKFKWEWLPV
jgi:hypothetical protein